MPPLSSRKQTPRKLGVERLEDRRLMTSLPYGAMVNDTGEFMLGRIAVTPVLMESNGAIDTNVYNWTSVQKEQVYNNVVDGMQWWSQLLAKKSSVHTLDWVFDRTYLDNPVPTSYEPIRRQSDDYVRWVPEFLDYVNFDQESSIDSNIRRFNDSQRQKLNADWSFTIFIVNSAPDQLFATGGEFSRAFAFAGGLYFVTPSNRSVSTYTHETGHIFYARDEYPGGANHYQKRGYYNTQNSNSLQGAPSGFQQAPSIMSAGFSLDTAYAQVESPASTLAQIGWQDSDGDGIFDVLDVPIEMNGVGSLNPTSNEYRYIGSASVKTLGNINSVGLQNDITLNKIGRYEYRYNQTGAWTTISALTTPDYQHSFDLRIPVPTGTTGFIEIRAIDPRTGVTSNIFRGDLNEFDQAASGGVSGFVWSETTADGQRQLNETGLAGWTVELVDASGTLVDVQSEIEPDVLPIGGIEGNEYSGVTLRAIGNDADGSMQVAHDTRATTGTRVFTPYSVRGREYNIGWREDDQNLEARFTTAQASVAVDVFGIAANSYARLEAYSSTGRLLERTTSGPLGVGQSAGLAIRRNSPDIAYVVVKGHLSSIIGIDNLRFGLPSRTTTGSHGDYRFAGLLPGTYYVKATPANHYTSTSPNNGIRQAVVVADQATTKVDLGFFTVRSPWQNPTLNVDVSSDGEVTPVDVLQVINALTRNGTRNLEGSSVPVQPFVDVDGDRSLTPLDVLVVINHLRRQSGGSGGEGPPSTSSILITQGIEPAHACGELPPADSAHLYLGHDHEGHDMEDHDDEDHDDHHLDHGTELAPPTVRPQTEAMPPSNAVSEAEFRPRSSTPVPATPRFTSRRHFLASSASQNLDPQAVDGLFALL